MTVQAHIHALEEKHHHLEDELRHALSHPSADERSITEIKRQKLRLKDEIARLKS